MEETDIKDRILRGAEELFMKYGVRSVSMDDIARHLSVSKKTLYHYFADKDEIVTMVLVFHMERDVKQYEGFHQTSTNAIDELVNVSACMKRDFQKINPSLLFDLQKYHARAWSVWMSHKEKYIKDSIVRNLKQGIEEGYFRKDISVEVLAIARLETIQLTFDERIFPAEKFNLSDVNVQIFEHFVYGILTDKGRKVYEKYKQEPQHTELTSQSI